MSELNRRDFLKIAASGLLTASGLLGLAELLRFLNSPTQPAIPTEFDLGLPENYPPGSRTVVAENTALLIHAENGFSAISLVCTHLGCTVETQSAGFICRCHGSAFDAQGGLLHGPAQKPLRALRIEINTDGHIILHTDL